MYVAILGRQPAISMAELEHLYGADDVQWFSDDTALVDADTLVLDHVGGTLKAGRVVLEFSKANWGEVNTKIIQNYTSQWAEAQGKLTLGLSSYGFSVSARDVQKIGILLKQRLKKAGVSLRIVPNDAPALSTAASHHNKLGLSPNKLELIIVRGKNGRVVVAESIGAQNITQLARRDQQRPKRDAFVGMLPPKLAQIIVNLAVGNADPKYGGKLLDPFCGTGVILQEAMLRGFDVYGSDISEKMVDYTDQNLMWLLNQPYSPVSAAPKDRSDPNWQYFHLEQGDATSHRWAFSPQFVAAEAYLGQPFSAPPSPAKLAEVRGNCNHILTRFLQNIGTQIQPGTSLCIAVPAWRDKAGNFTHLPLINQLEKLGYHRHAFTHVTNDDLLYYRPNQVVGRELLVLTKA